MTDKGPPIAELVAKENVDILQTLGWEQEDDERVRILLKVRSVFAQCSRNVCEVFARCSRNVRAVYM